MDWGSVIGGIGIGSVAASAVTQWLNAKTTRDERTFSKKEGAYLDLLDALYVSEIVPTTENAKKYGLCHNKVLLVGSPDVANYSQGVINSVPNSDERRMNLDNLMRAMRADLSIDSRELSSSSFPRRRESPSMDGMTS